MNCICGNDLGAIGPGVKGLCNRCGRSKWMQVVRRIEPNRQRILGTLNGLNAEVCEHGRDPCITRCGVRRVGSRWQPIAEAERQVWYDRQLNENRVVYRYRLYVNDGEPEFVRNPEDLRRFVDHLDVGERYQVADLETGRMTYPCEVVEGAERRLEFVV